MDEHHLGSSSNTENQNYNFEEGLIREQDRLLPIANVGRIMKQILPPNAKISKEAKETMQECVSEFISFVTGEASDKCIKEKRKTVNGDDVCWALGSLGFDDYAGPLKRYLYRYRELEGEKANQNKDMTGVNEENSDCVGEPSGGHNMLPHKLEFNVVGRSQSTIPRRY